MRQTFFNRRTGALLVSIFFGAAYVPQAFAIPEGSGVKSQCTSAQDFGAVPLPFSIEGTLTPIAVPSSGGFFDADYFKVTGTPGDTVAVEYIDNSQQTAVLGTQGSSCDQRPLETDQDPGFASGIRLRLKVPDDGVVILSASQFNATPNVAYQMLVRHYVPYLGTISGQILAADSGNPPTEASFITLVKCEGAECKAAATCAGAECKTIATMRTDGQGRFTFAGPLGDSIPAEPGTFQIFVSGTKPGTQNSTPTFTLTANENKNLGSISLQFPDAAAHIGSISGRVVDTVSGVPLSGTAEPFAKVLLYACPDPKSCGRVSITDADAQGRFLFTEANNGGVSGAALKLSPGKYSIKVLANQYDQVVASDAGIFEVSKDQNLNAGDIRVQSLPVRFSHLTSCSKPVKGGVCVYSVMLTNGLATAFNGEVWSVVNANRISSQVSITSFQTGTAERLSLNVGKSRTVKFSMPLPTAAVPNNVNICADAYVGTRPNAVWNTVGHTSVFCMTKSELGLSLKSAKAAFELSNHLRDK